MHIQKKLNLWRTKPNLVLTGFVLPQLFASRLCLTCIRRLLGGWDGLVPDTTWLFVRAIEVTPPILLIACLTGADWQSIGFFHFRFISDMALGTRDLDDQDLRDYRCD